MASASNTPTCKPTYNPSPDMNHTDPLATKYKTLKVSYTDTFTIQLNSDNDSSSSDSDDDDDDDDDNSSCSTNNNSIESNNHSQSTASLLSCASSNNSDSPTISFDAPSQQFRPATVTPKSFQHDIHDMILLDPSSSTSSSDSHKLPHVPVYDTSGTKTNKRSSKSQVINKILFAKFDRRLRRYKDLSKKRKTERARDLACNIIAACMSHGECHSNCDNVYEEKIVGNGALFEDCIHLVDSMKFMLQRIFFIPLSSIDTEGSFSDPSEDNSSFPVDHTTTQPSGVARSMFTRMSKNAYTEHWNVLLEEFPTLLCKGTLPSNHQMCKYIPEVE